MSELKLFLDNPLDVIDASLLPNDFKVLIACEESQTVCKAFRSIGVQAYSCDIQECSGGHQDWHVLGDAIKEAYSGKYSLMIAHPPCTYLSRAGARWLFSGGKIDLKRYELGLQAKDFFMKMINAPIPYVAVENPLPLKIFELPKHTQRIEPYMFGHKYSKRTLLWLKNLPILNPTKIEEDYTPYLPSNTGGKKRGQKAVYRSISQKQASKTFEGVANAMAIQWTARIIDDLKI